MTTPKLRSNVFVVRLPNYNWFEINSFFPEPDNFFFFLDWIFDVRLDFPCHTISSLYKKGGKLNLIDISYAKMFPSELTFMVSFPRRWLLDAGTDTSKYIHIMFGNVDISSPSNTETSCPSSYVEIRDYPLGK